MKYLLFVVAVCGVTTASCYAQSQNSNQEMRTQRPEITDWSWVNKPWTGQSSPYVSVTRRIDAAFADEKRIDSVTQKYRTEAKAKPSDALAQYAWGYAAYAGRPLGYPVKMSELPDIAMALAVPTPPNAYEYNRLRFVVTVRWMPYLQLKPLGKRLLQRSPNDFDVKRGMVNLLVVGPTAERQQALAYAQQLVHTYPKEVGAYSSLGWAYDITFARTKDSATGNKAIAAYRTCISLSKNPSAQNSVEHNISVIQQEQKQWRKQSAQ